ncbi:MAG: ZIP family metal transporter [Candidatus Aenigmarchaeota archaeon]|nr:ZIP family metal transporter [Candidatus Aenigmarchaeota archaeon]
MVETLLLIVLFTIFGSVASLVGGGMLLAKEKFTKKNSIYFVGFAAGALLGTVFFDFLPEILEYGTDSVTFTMPLLGIVAFFILENLLRWHHHHAGKEVHTFNYTITIGDSIHNLIDGIVIAAAFLVNAPLGIATSIAVFFHEIPQEIGDFGVLLRGGWSRTKVISYNILSALVSIAGAVATFFYASPSPGLTANLIAFTAGIFIYIAGVDLIPEIHHEKRTAGIMLAFTIFLLLGIAVIYGVTQVLPE